MDTVCWTTEENRFGTGSEAVETVEKVAQPLFRVRLHARQASISCEKVDLPCVRSVISDAHVAGNDGIKIYSAACGHRNSLQEGFLTN